MFKIRKYTKHNYIQTREYWLNMLHVSRLSTEFQIAEKFSGTKKNVTEFPSDTLAISMYWGS